MDLTELITSSDTNLTISSAKLQECEDRLRLLLLRDYSDTGFSPNSVVGKFLIERFGKIVAQIESALECTLSDVNLVNALNGIVCNCDFVTEFLRGLGVDSLANANTTGTARLSFIVNGPTDSAESDPFVMDRGELIQFNDAFIFNYSVFKNAPIKIYPYGYTGNIDYDSNYFFLSVANTENLGATTTNYQPNSYFVDIPIVGPSNAEVNEGDEGGINELLTFFSQVSSVVAAYDITPFESPTTLSELIDLCLKIQPSANFATRINIISFLNQKYPGLTGVSPVKTGDTEMQRSSESIMNVGQPALDLFIKGSSTLKECTEQIRFEVEFDSGGTIQRLVSAQQDMHLQHYPVMSVGFSIGDAVIDDTSNTLDPATFSILFQNALSLKDPINTYRQVSTSLAGEHIPYYFYDFSNSQYVANIDTNNILDTAARSKLLAAFPKNSRLTNYITQETTSGDAGDTTKSYIWLSYTYLYDAVKESIGNFVFSPACDPIVSTEVKSCFYYYLTNFTVNYTKETNKFFDRQAAFDKLYELMNSLVYPLSYADAYISDIMLSLGASGIQSITVQGNLMLGSAGAYNDKNGTLVTPEASAGAQYPLSINIDPSGNGVSASNGLNPNNTDIVSQTFLQYGVGPRSISILLPLENINLVEVRTS